MNYLNKLFIIYAGSSTHIAGYVYIYNKEDNRYIGFTVLRSGKIFTKDIWGGAMLEQPHIYKSNNFHDMIKTIFEIDIKQINTQYT